MQDKSINQIDKPELSSQISQPYIVQLIPQSYVHQPNHPDDVQLPNQSNAIQQLDQPGINNPITDPYAIDKKTNYFGQRFNEPVMISPGYFKKKLCFAICFTLFLLTGLLISGFFVFAEELVPIEEVIGCIVAFIGSFLVYKSAETYDVKKYNIALYLFTVYFTSVTIVNSYNFNAADYYRKDSLMFFYLLEFGVESLTLFILCYNKRVFETKTKSDNQQLVSH